MTLTDSRRETLGADDPPPLAVLVYDDGDRADLEMAAAVRVLAAGGRRLAGVVQTNVVRPDRRRCDMRLRDLASGEDILISQDLGDQADGCRLDLDAFAHANLLVERALEAGADVLVVNRFGKQEAQGRGFAGAIATALGLGLPVVVAVSRLNRGALETFVGASPSRIAIRSEAIVAWCTARLSAPARSA